MEGRCIGVGQEGGLLDSGHDFDKVVGKFGVAWEGVGAGNRVNGRQRG